MHAGEIQPEWDWTETVSLVGLGQADFPSAALGHDTSCDMVFHALQPLCDDRGVLLVTEPSLKAPKTGSCSVKLCYQEPPLPEVNLQITEK